MSKQQHIGNIVWDAIQPDRQHTWLTEGLHSEFGTFVPIGAKEAKAIKGATANVIFKTYCRGIVTGRDVWVYNFNQDTLDENVQRIIDTYNVEVDRWKRREDQQESVSDFVVYDDTKIKRYMTIG